MKRYWRLVFAFATPTSPFELGEELVLEAQPGFVDRLLQACIPVGLASYEPEGEARHCGSVQFSVIQAESVVWVVFPTPVVFIPRQNLASRPL